MGRWDVGSLDVFVVVWLGIPRMNKIEQWSSGVSRHVFFFFFSLDVNGSGW